MVSRRFNRFLVGLMFIFLALRDSVASTHKATEKMVIADGNTIVAAGVSPSTLDEKENFHAVPAANEAEKETFGGRKMMERMVLGKEMVKEEGTNGGSSKISGRSMNVSKKPLGTTEEHMNEQNDANMAKTKPLGSERQSQLCSQDSEADTSKGRLVCSSTRSKTLVLHQESDYSSLKFQSQKLPDHQAAKEIVNLTNKDYSETSNPHPRPPINNYEPLHHDKVRP